MTSMIMKTYHEAMFAVRQRIIVRSQCSPWQFGRTPKWGVSNRFLRSLYWACRGFQYWLCFYDEDVDIDVEDLLSNPFNTQPPSLEQLRSQTGFQKEWIMFLYRNFKQRCSNGRMNLSQWRQIFRPIFPNASDYGFADRIFETIAGNRSQRSITFEDLILCLHDLICSEEISADSASTSAQSSNIAQFIFKMMQPDERGLVSVPAFTNYVECVFNLNAITSPSMSREGVFGQMQISSTTSHSNPQPTCTPSLRNYAVEQFKLLDADCDGFLTQNDIERVLANTSRDGLALMTAAQVQNR
uniref:EF-hand domain-containing protein n=1 Tax=Ascaris lumbricoides TaxID=6252 RepID=A0A0M3HRR8_ASCLU